MSTNARGFCMSSVAQTVGGLLGKVRSGSDQASRPLPSSVLCASDSADVPNGQAWGEQPHRHWRRLRMCRGLIQNCQWLHGKSCAGAIPGGRGLRTRDEGPISRQQECIEVPPGARHGAQLRERPERGTADRQWCQGCSLPVSPVSQPSPWHQAARPEQWGSLLLLSLHLEPLSPSWRELWMLRLTEE